MILTRGVVRVLGRIGKAAAAALILGALAAGLWHFALAGLVRGDERPSPASVAQATGSPLLIYSEFGTNSDAIWAARADDLSERIPIATVDHAAEYGIYASLSPNGRYIAYTALPSSGAKPGIDSPAEVWVMDSDGRHRRRLATGADLPIEPVWAPDSASLVFRRSNGGDSASSFQLVRVTLAGAETEMLDTSQGVLPVGFAPDGSLYFTQFSAAGTDLEQVAPSGDGVPVAHLSDDFARDWHLSPDGSRLAFLAPRLSADIASFRAMVVDIGAGKESTLKAMTAVQAEDDEFNPIWRPNGELTVGRLKPSASGAPVLRIAGDQPVGAMAAPPLGFDVPLSWSPDGTYLAVRFFEGSSAANPGRSWVMVVSTTGVRHTVSANSDVAVLGWFGGGG